MERAERERERFYDHDYDYPAFNRQRIVTPGKTGRLVTIPNPWGAEAIVSDR